MRFRWFMVMFNGRRSYGMMSNRLSVRYDEGVGVGIIVCGIVKVVFVVVFVVLGNGRYCGGRVFGIIEVFFVEGMNMVGVVFGIF